MILIIGLRNKGTEFQNTRHNIGAEIIMRFGENNHFQKFKLESDCNLSSLKTGK